jgi:chromosome segregation ATPase
MSPCICPQRKQEHRDSDAQLTEIKRSLQVSEATNGDLRKELLARAGEIEELSLSLDKAQRELEKQRGWRDECTSLEQRLISSNSRAAELEREKAELEREKAELEKSLSAEMQTSVDLQEAQTKMKTRCGDLQDALNTALLKTDKLERALQTMSRTRDSLESQLSEANQLYESRLSKKCLELKGSLDRTSELHLSLTSRSAELQSLQTEHLSLQKSLKMSEESLKSSELCVETVNYSCKTLHEELAGLVRQCDEWKHSCLALEKRLQDSAQDMANLQREKTDLQRSSAELTAQLLSETSLKAIALATLESTVQQSSAERRSHESLVEDLNQQLLTAESLRGDLSTELSHRSQTISELNEQLRVSQTEAHTLKRMVSEQQEVLSTLQTQLDSSSSAAASLKSHLAELRLESETAHTANEISRRENTQLLTLLEAHKVRGPFSSILSLTSSSRMRSSRFLQRVIAKTRGSRSWTCQPSRKRKGSKSWRLSSLD